MAERISSARAKAQLPSLVAQVAYGGKHFIIERRGRPLAALVTVADLERLEQGPPGPSPQPQGFLALVGAWKDVGDEEIDKFIKDIYTARAADTGRAVDLEA